MRKIELKELIAPSFYGLHHDVQNNKYTHYWLEGGRGSTKSSFTSLELILGIMKDPEANAMVLRKVGQTLRESVFEQLLWAIDALGVSGYWKDKVSPLELTYVPTGQKILFRGADKPKKIKSAKLRKGYFKYAWYEEVDEFGGMEEVRMINQSLMRGGEVFCFFYTYNPPQSVRNWVNQESLVERPDKRIHHSTYLTVPRAWLGEQFLIEAEHLKKVNHKAYEHEYLGEVTGTGGEVFSNVTARRITDEEIASFDRIKRGLDWGYAVDPFAYVKTHFDATRRRLYIFAEVYKVGLSNRAAVKEIQKVDPNPDLITGDSAEPKSIAEVNTYGLRVKGARKGPDSVKYGIKFLQDLEEIVIDGERCPNTLREFTSYELDRDASGNFKADFPDRDNHTIDACRYALEDEMKYARARIVKKPKGF